MKKHSDLLAQALKRTARDEEGGYLEEDLLIELESLLEIDVDVELRRMAKAIVDSAAKPGGTKETGQLHLPGMEPYNYEPLRLIRDNERKLIEQDHALPRYKFAESNRASKHSLEAAEWAERKRIETQMFSEWVIQQQRRGRLDDLTFGDYVREADILIAFAAEEV